jgi:hypothetical protein
MTVICSDVAGVYVLYPDAKTNKKRLSRVCIANLTYGRYAWPYF